MTTTILLVIAGAALLVGMPAMGLGIGMLVKPVTWVLNKGLARANNKLDELELPGDALGKNEEDEPEPPEKEVPPSGKGCFASIMFGCSGCALTILALVAAAMAIVAAVTL